MEQILSPHAYPSRQIHLIDLIDIFVSDFPSLFVLHSEASTYKNKCAHMNSDVSRGGTTLKEMKVRMADDKPGFSLRALFPPFAQEDAPYASAAAFRQLYEQSHLSIYRFIYSMHGGPAEDVEDLTAETFERAWKARKRFEGDQEAAIGWLITIARNQVIDAQRRRKRRGSADRLDDVRMASPPDAEVEHLALWYEQQEVLLSLLQTLPDQEREMLILRYVLGWQVKRIAAHYGLQENTASVQIRRTLQRLQRRWPCQTEDSE